MNIVKTISQYNIKNVYYSEPLTNTVMDNSKFFRIIYSTPFMTLNSIYIKINIVGHVTDRYFNKVKYIFDTVKNKGIIDSLVKIEKSILEKNNNNTQPVYKIAEQLKLGYIKIFDSTDVKDFVQQTTLKISGIWENEMSHGITYKFMTINHL